MAGDGSDQRALQYEQTLVSSAACGTLAAGHSCCCTPDAVHAPLRKLRARKLQPRAGRCVPVRCVRCVRAESTGVWYWQILLADPAGGCGSPRRSPEGPRSRGAPGAAASAAAGLGLSALEKGTTTLTVFD